MANVTKSTTGPATPSLVCSVEIPTGEAQFVSEYIFLHKMMLIEHLIKGLAVNFLLIESLQRFYQYYGSELQVECPTGSGDYMDLGKVAEEIQHIFLLHP